MTVKCLTPATREEWLALRRHDVTASQIAAVVGLHPYCTAYELWCLKRGHAEPDTDSPAMARGRRLEPLAIDLVREHFGSATVLPNGGPRFYYRDTLNRIGATPDCLVSHPERGLGTVQIKTVEPSTFRRSWHGDDGAIEPPLWVGLQTLTEAKLVPEVTWAAVAVMRVGYAIDFDLVEVPLHAGAWDRIKAAVADFWRLVEAGTPPPPDYNRDGKLIASLYPQDAGTELDLSHDNEFVNAVAARSQLKIEAAIIAKDLDRLEAEIRHKAGAAQRVVAGDYVVTLKTENRKEYTVPAGTRRPLRIKLRTGAVA